MMMEKDILVMAQELCVVSIITCKSNKKEMLMPRTRMKKNLMRRTSRKPKRLPKR